MLQADRALANLLRVLFLEERARNASDPVFRQEAFDVLRKQVQAAANLNASASFFGVLSAYVNSTLEKYKTRVSTTMTDASQQSHFAYAIALDDYKTAYKEYQQTIDDLRMSSRAARVELALERLTLQLVEDGGLELSSYDTEKARVTTTMKTFMAAWSKVVNDALNGVYSPVDSRGLLKSSEHVAHDARRSALISQIAAQFDPDEVARRVRDAMNVSTHVLLEPLLTDYLRDELARRENALHLR